MAIAMSPQKVLVVDDEDHILELARLYLSREGYQIETVTDGAQALASFGQIKPDLVVLDIMLPNVDGLTICREIRKQSQVPIIMLTARDEVTDKVVDLERHEVRHGESKLQLRPKEFDLLALLARHPGRVFQRSELLDLVWGYDFPGYTRTVDVHVQQVREKLAAAEIKDPSIQTVWGVGYRLELAGSAT